MRLTPAFAPTRRLAIVVAAVAPLWLVPGEAGVRIAGTAMAIVALACLVDAFMLPGRASLALERILPRSVGIGDDVDGTYRLTARWDRRLQVTLHDAFPPELRGGVGVTELLALDPGEVLEVRFGLVALTRGEWTPGSVALRVRGSVGLIVRRVVYDFDEPVAVVPSTAGVRRFRLLAMQERLASVGVRTMKRTGEGRAFSRLREYVPGDDPRYIDWKATGKRGKLIAREFTVEQAQTVITLVDAGRAMTQLAGEFPRFEHALSSALVLTDVAAHAGDRVGTLVFDDAVRAWVPPQRGREALRAVREAMAPVRASMAEPDYAAAFRVLATRQRRRALIVFFTDVLDPRASRSLLAHLSRGAQRHLVVVVALRNDPLFAAARPRRTTSGALAEAAAAEELILGREEALERMRRLGVTVLDVSPTAMTAAVVNRYLEIKSRGAL